MIEEKYFYLNFCNFRGRELQKRLAERVKEAESDSRDRAKEKEEIEELKHKIYSSEYDDPNAEFERVYIFLTDIKPLLTLNHFRLSVNMKSSTNRNC